MLCIFVLYPNLSALSWNRVDVDWLASLEIPLRALTNQLKTADGKFNMWLWDRAKLVNLAMGVVWIAGRW